MTITLSPEHERIIEARLASGQFRSVDELLDYYLAPLLEDNGSADRIVKAHAAADRIRELRNEVTLLRPAGVTLREYAHLGHRY